MGIRARVWCVSGVALVAFLLFDRQVLSRDVVALLGALANDGSGKEQAGWMGPLVSFVHGATGIGYYHELRWVNALCVALSLPVFHSALARIAKDDRDSLHGALLLVTLPAWIVAGVLPHSLGVFVLLSAVATHLAARHAARPSLGAGALAGLASLAALWGHEAALCLPAALLVLVFSGDKPVRALLPGALALVVVHAAGALALHLSYEREAWGRVFDAPDWARIGFAAHREWIRPYMPPSVVAVLALARRSTFRGALVLLVGVALSAAMSLLWIQDDMHTGALFLPFAPALCLLAIRSLGGRARVVLAAVGLAIGALAVNGPQPDPFVAKAAQGLRRLAPDGSLALITFRGNFDDELTFAQAPRVTLIDMRHALDTIKGPQELFIGHMVQAIDRQFDAGRRVVMTVRAEAILVRMVEQENTSMAMLSWRLRALYDLVPVVSGSFRGTELLRKPN